MAAPPSINQGTLSESTVPSLAPAANAIPLSQLTLFPATRAQIDESRRRTWELWGRPRGATLEEYLERDLKTEEHEVGRDGRMVTWVLTRRSDPTGLDFLCSCETFKREGYVVEAHNGETQGRSVACYGIASAFTSTQHRKKGYASHMMRLLHWVLAPEAELPVGSFPTAVWGERPKREEWGGARASAEGHGGDAEFSVLYSDVGGEFYKKCGVLPGEEGTGWVCEEAISTGWDVDKEKERAEEGEGWEWMDLEAVSEMWKVDAEMMKRDMMALGGGERACTFLPDKGVAEFQVLRLEYFWEKLEVPVRAWGVRKGVDVFASWTVDHNTDGTSVLLVTRVRVSKEDFQGLVGVLVGFAQRHGLRHVEFWGLRQELRENVWSWDRDEHLPSLKSYRGSYKWRFDEK